MRRCLHNHSDPLAVNILQKLADALADDSKLLIAEDVLEDPPYFIGAFMDFMMMVLGGKSRSLANWEQIVGAAGLKITSVSRAKGPWRTASVIECVKKT